MNHILLLLLLLFTSCAKTIPAVGSDYYYLRSDLKTKNGIVTEANLLMVPAENDFRVTGFTLYRLTGSVRSDNADSGLEAAKQNAFSELLQKKGIRSIKSQSESTASTHHDESILSFEGFIRTDYKIVNHGLSDDRTIYSVDLEVWFAPTAYPTSWSFYYFKKKLSEIVGNMVSVFR